MFSFKQSKFITFFMIILFSMVFTLCKKKHTEDPLKDFHPPIWVNFKSVKGGKLITGSFFNMDTIYTVTIATKNIKLVPEAVNTLKQVRTLIKNIELQMSSHLKTGDVYKINNSKGKKIQISPETFFVIQTSLKISELSEGAFDITWAGIRDLYNIKDKNWIPPTENQITKALKNVGWEKIKLYPKIHSVQLASKFVKIDLGGIAKGYALDKAEELITQKFQNYIINGGGDLKIGGQRPDRPWTISIRHPRNKGEMLKRGFFKGGAIVTSGDYERFKIINGKRYSHILDPRVGHTEQKILSVTIVGKNAMIADALATSICVEGVKKGMKMLKSFPNYETLIMDRDFNVFESSGFKSFWITK